MEKFKKMGAEELPKSDTDIIAKLEKLIHHYGTIKKLADMLGITKTPISSWRNRHRDIPDNRAVQIEKLYTETFSTTPLLPHTMTSLNQWVMWCGKENINKETGEVKMTKVPYRGNSHYKASSTNPKHWCKYDDLPINDDFYTGIGLVIVEGLIFIDFDHVLNSDETFKTEAKWAEELIEKLHPKYTEISPSGDGLHCFFKGKLPAGHRNKIKMGNGTELEVYTKERFSTITANPFNNSPLELVELSAEGIDALIEVIGVSSEKDVVDTTAKSTIAISNEKLEMILDDIELLDSEEMSSIDFAFFKDYINARRLFDTEFIPTEEEMKEALTYKGMFELREKISISNPEKYTKHKTYISLTIKKAVEAIGEGFETLDAEKAIFLTPSGKYHIVKDDKFTPDISAGAIKTYVKNWKMNFKNVIPVVAIEHKVDYFNDQAFTWSIDNDVLVLITNPTKLWNVSLVLDEEVIEDYTQKVLNGKLDDIIKLVFWSVRFKVDKLNKLLSVDVRLVVQIKYLESTTFV